MDFSQLTTPEAWDAEQQRIHDAEEAIEDLRKHAQLLTEITPQVVWVGELDADLGYRPLHTLQPMPALDLAIDFDQAIKAVDRLREQFDIAFCEYEIARISGLANNARHQLDHIGIDMFPRQPYDWQMAGDSLQAVYDSHVKPAIDAIDGRLDKHLGSMHTRIDARHDPGPRRDEAIAQWNRFITLAEQAKSSVGRLNECYRLLLDEEVINAEAVDGLDASLEIRTRNVVIAMGASYAVIGKYVSIHWETREPVTRVELSPRVQIPVYEKMGTWRTIARMLDHSIEASGTRHLPYPLGQDARYTLKVWREGKPYAELQASITVLNHHDEVSESIKALVEIDKNLLVEQDFKIAGIAPLEEINRNLLAELDRKTADLDQSLMVALR